MSTPKKYKCPYCDYRGTREDLVSHVDKVHEDMIPENYTAARVVYNHINNRTSGSCIVCHRETEWDENRWKYKRLCGRPECKKALSDQADKNMTKKYGTKTLLNDPKHQEKMMFNRSISGTYKFTDGGIKNYVGSYEKKALEFMDKVLEIDSTDLIIPGPTIQYTHKNELHSYIPDMYYIPYNLIIEIKDGGNNPNTRNMEEYRKKQIEKEKEIIKLNKYNYIRLTNNEFDQLLSIFTELKYQMLNDKTDDGKIIRIHEEVSGIPSASDQSVYIVPYGFKNTFNDEYVEDYGYTTDLDSIIVKDKETNKFKKESFNDFLDGRNFNISTISYSIKEALTIDKENIDYNFNIKEYNIDLKILDKNTLIPLIESPDSHIASDPDGYYYYDELSCIRTKSYKTINELESNRYKFINIIGGEL